METRHYPPLENGVKIEGCSRGGSARARGSAGAGLGLPASLDSNWRENTAAMALSLRDCHGNRRVEEPRAFLGQEHDSRTAEAGSIRPAATLVERRLPCQATPAGAGPRAKEIYEAPFS